MKYYCTLFNKAYLNKGLTMIRSLERCHKSDAFIIFVLALDDETYKFLINYSIGSNIRIFPLKSEMEKRFNLLEQKFGRPNVFWGMGSQWMAHCLKTMNIDHVSCLDADLYFFSDPKVIFDEINGAEVGITPHRFPSYDFNRLRPNGLYNVSIVVAKKSALLHIEEWAEQTMQKCDSESCGDQKALDTWKDKLGDRLATINNCGVNLAAWNIGRFDISEMEGDILVTDIENDYLDSKLVFYHMHEHKSPQNRTGYPMKDSYIKLIYEPYEKELADVKSLQIDS